MIAGKDAKEARRSKNSWLTGTAARNFVAVSQWILGIKPGYEGLMVDPCIPSDWEGFTVKRYFRNAMYNISVKNPDKVSKGIRKLTVDGKEFIGNVLPVFRNGREHSVEVVTGND